MNLSSEPSKETERGFTTIGEAVEILKFQLPSGIVRKFFQNIREYYKDINLYWGLDPDANVLVDPNAEPGNKAESVSSKEMLALYLRDIIKRLIAGALDADVDMESVNEAVIIIRNFIQDELGIDFESLKIFKSR